jgi:hypothetical protein
MGTQGASQCVGCGVVGENEEDNEDGHFYCYAFWLIYHAALEQIAARLLKFSRNASFRVYLGNPVVRSMCEAFRMNLLHLDNNRSCSSPAHVRNVALFRMHLLYLNSVPNEPAHRSPRKQHMCMTLKPSSLKSEVGIRVLVSLDSDEGDHAVEGSEEHFDESEPVNDGLAEEERSTGGEDGSGQEGGETEGEECLSLEGSDFAAEEVYEEGDSNAEEGHEEVWDEVHEALSTMGHEDNDETALCARSQASRSSSSSSSSRASVLS